MESAPGIGSTFWVELPAILSSSTKEKQADKVIENKPNLNSKTQYSVLYIEDNEANLRLVTQLLLRRENIQIVGVRTPELGIQRALQDQPDLILLDINLPGVSGFDVLKTLRLRDESKNIPIIAVSANAMDKDIEMGLSAGFDDYVTKPIDLVKFLERVESTLGLTA